MVSRHCTRIVAVNFARRPDCAANPKVGRCIERRGHRFRSTAIAPGSFREPVQTTRVNPAILPPPRQPQSPSRMVADLGRRVPVSKAAGETGRPGRRLGGQQGRRDPVCPGSPRRKQSAYRGEAGFADTRRWLLHDYRRKYLIRRGDPESLEGDSHPKLVVM
jgi:hypothetical protein